MSDGPPQPHGGAGFWLSATAGWALIVIGVRGMLANSVDTRPADLARFVVIGALVHDLVVAPVVLAVGTAVARTVRGSARTALQVALFLTAVTALYAYPLVRGFGRASRNPSSLPHDYAANLTMVLGAVWAVAAAALLWRSLRRTARRPVDR